MKDINNFVAIFESKHHVDTATVADFFQWACLYELPDGKCDASDIDKGDVIGLLDNGWFDVFGDAGPHEEKKVREFFKKNWDKNIKVHSDETDNDWEVWFELDGKTYSAAFLTYFGDMSHHA